MAEPANVRTVRCARRIAPGPAAKTVAAARAPCIYETSLHIGRMMDGNVKQLMVVGDRVLIRPEEGEERSRVGLYLPPSAVDNQAIQGGSVVATGPGTPISPPTELGDEPWKMGSSGEARYLPVQAEVGDYAIFFRRAAVEITFEGTKYLVVPLAAILVLVREGVQEQEQEQASW